MRNNIGKANDELLPLLQYRVSNQPSPLQVSLETIPTRGRLNISVFNSKGVYCNQFELYIPYDDSSEGDKDALFSTLPEISVNKEDWNLFAKSNCDNAAVFTFQHRSLSPHIVEDGLTFSIVGDVSKKTGVSTFYVEEYSSEQALLPEAAREACFTREKVSPEFYVNNFISTNPENYSIPCSMFECGKPVRLSWESNGSYFRLFKRNETVPCWEGSQTSCTLSNGCENDTTFILAACMSGDWNLDCAGPDSLYAPILIYKDLTITVSNPKLTLTTLSVSGDTKLNSKLSVDGDAALNSKLSVVGDAKLNGKLGVNTIETVSAESPLLINAVINTKGLKVAEGAAQFDADVVMNGALDLLMSKHLSLFNPSCVKSFSKNKDFILEFSCDSDGIILACTGSLTSRGWLSFAYGTHSSYTYWTSVFGIYVNGKFLDPNMGLLPFHKNQPLLIWFCGVNMDASLDAFLSFYPFGNGNVQLKEIASSEKELAELNNSIPMQFRAQGYES